MTTTIHDVVVGLQAYLTAQGCPVRVIDGPERAKRTAWGAEAVVLEHDDGVTAFGPPRGLHRNANHRYTATDNFKATIYVQSRVGAAHTFEHRARAHAVREMVVAGLEYVVKGAKNPFEPKAGSWITPPDLAESERLNGAAYELKFAMGLPVRIVTFAGAAATEGTLSGLTSTTQVGRAGADIDDTEDNPNTLETACGA